MKIKILFVYLRTMEREYTVNEEQLSRIAKALAHPARIAIMHFLARQESCFFGDIHEVLPIAKATVSQHLTELKNAGLIQGEIIQPKVKYCVNRKNWMVAKSLFVELFDSCIEKKGCCE